MKKGFMDTLASLDADVFAFQGNRSLRWPWIDLTRRAWRTIPELCRPQRLLQQHSATSSLPVCLPLSVRYMQAWADEIMHHEGTPDHRNS